MGRRLGVEAALQGPGQERAQRLARARPGRCRRGPALPTRCGASQSSIVAASAVIGEVGPFLALGAAQEHHPLAPLRQRLRPGQRVEPERGDAARQAPARPPRSPAPAAGARRGRAPRAAARPRARKARAARSKRDLVGLGDARPRPPLRSPPRATPRPPGCGPRRRAPAISAMARKGSRASRSCASSDGAAPVRHQVFARLAARFGDAIRDRRGRGGAERSAGGRAPPSCGPPLRGGMCAIRAQPSAMLPHVVRRGGSGRGGSARRGRRGRRRRRRGRARRARRPGRRRPAPCSGERPAAARTMRASRGGRGSAAQRAGPLSVMRPSAIEGAELVAGAPAPRPGPGRAADRGRRACADRRRPRRRSRGASGARSADRISGRREGLERAGRRLLPEPVADAGLGAAGAAAALVGGGARDAHRLEPRQADVGLVDAARGRGPQSITTRTPSMVSEVSAIEVASTTLRRPGRRRLRPRDPARRGRARRRAARGRPPDRRSALAQQRLDAADLALPGQEDEDRAALGAQRPRDRVRDLGPRCGGSGRGRDSGSRPGRRGPRMRITGASPRSPATRAPSSVADMTRRRRSSRRPPCASSASARPRSASRERSWNSSNSTAATPSSAGSSRIMRAKTPSVTTSMRVRRPIFEPSRTRRPTVSPTASPSVAAMRSAAARAARRRGSSTMSLRPVDPGLVEQRQRHPRGLAGAGRRDQHRVRRAPRAPPRDRAAPRRWEAECRSRAWRREFLAEARRAERGQVDARRLAREQLGHELAGHRRAGHADMAVTEGVDDVRRAPRAADRRQRVRAGSGGGPSRSRCALPDSSP